MDRQRIAFLRLLWVSRILFYPGLRLSTRAIKPVPYPLTWPSTSKQIKHDIIHCCWRHLHVSTTKCFIPLPPTLSRHTYALSPFLLSVIVNGGDGQSTGEDVSDNIWHPFDLHVGYWGHRSSLDRQDGFSRPLRLLCVRIYPISQCVSIAANASRAAHRSRFPCSQARSRNRGAADREMNELSSYQVWTISLGPG